MHHSSATTMQIGDGDFADANEEIYYTHDTQFNVTAITDTRRHNPRTLRLQSANGSSKIPKPKPHRPRNLKLRPTNPLHRPALRHRNRRSAQRNRPIPIPPQILPPNPRQIHQPRPPQVTSTVVHYTLATSHKLVVWIRVV